MVDVLTKHAASRPPDDLGDPRIENRRLGLDKRLIAPTLGVLAVVIFWAGFIPWLDETIEGDPLAPDTPLSLAGGVEFTPAEGWSASGAVLPGSTSLTIFKGAVTMSISPGAWNGTPDELLDELIDRADPIIKGDRVSITLPAGESVGVDTLGEDDQGFLLAIVSEELFNDRDDRVTAIRVETRSSVEYTDDDEADMAEMIASIRVIPLDERSATPEEDGE